MNKDNEIAFTTLQQLGGNKFLVMTGSKAVLDGNALHLRLVKNMSKANRLDVTLDGNDTYTMRFYFFRLQRCALDKKKGEFRIIPEKNEDIEVLEGVYCDQLQDIFEQITGLYTTLFPRK